MIFLEDLHIRIRGFIDGYRSPALLTGWAFDDHHSALVVRAFYGDQLLGETDVGAYRPDLGPKGSGNVGFMLEMGPEFDMNAFLSGCIQVRVFDKQSHKQLATLPIYSALAERLNREYRERQLHIRSRPIFVIALQRSGTNLLRRALESTKQLIDCDEVFHHEFLNQWSFWTFKNEFIKTHPIIVPTDQEMAGLWDAFVNHTAAKCQTLHGAALIDIKINSLHSLNPVWQNPLEMPFLLRQLCEKQERIIHLVRDNFLDLYVSQLVAVQVGKFVVPAGNALSVNQFTVDVRKALDFIRRRDEELKLASRWMTEAESRGAVVLKLNYRDLVSDSGTLDLQITRAIETRFGFPRGSLEDACLATSKMTPPITQIITNFNSEVVPALNEAGYGHLVSEDS